MIYLYKFINQLLFLIAALILAAVELLIFLLESPLLAFLCCCCWFKEFNNFAALNFDVDDDFDVWSKNGFGSTIEKIWKFPVKPETVPWHKSQTLTVDYQGIFVCG